MILFSDGPSLNAARSQSGGEFLSEAVQGINYLGLNPLNERQQIGEMLRDWDRRFPGRIETLFRSLANVVPSHLMDGRLYDFTGLKASGTPDPDGDIAFDADEEPVAAVALNLLR